MYKYYFLFRLRIKVCNVKDLTRLKRELLRKFPALEEFLSNGFQTSLSSHSMESLNLKNEEYCVGCTLVQNKTVRAQCISNLTVAGK